MKTKKSLLNKVPEENINIFKRLVKYIFIPTFVLVFVAAALNHLTWYAAIYPVVALTYYFALGRFFGHTPIAMVYSQHSQRLAKILLHITLVFIVIIPLMNISLSPDYLRFAPNVPNATEKVLTYIEVQSNKTGKIYNASDVQLLENLLQSFNPTEYLSAIINTFSALIMLIFATLLLALYTWLIKIENKQLLVFLQPITSLCFVIALFAFIYGLFLFLSGLYIFYKYFTLIAFQYLPI